MGARPAASHLDVSARGQAIIVMDASVFVVATYPLQLLVEPLALTHYCQHQCSLVRKKRVTVNHTDSYRQLEDDINTTMLEVFGDYDIDTGSDNSDNDSLGCIGFIGQFVVYASEQHRFSVTF